VDSIFDQLQSTLQQQGPSAALGSLVDFLTQSKQYHRLFEALTLRAKFDLNLPVSVHADLSQIDLASKTALEDRLMQACRDVGNLLLEDGDVPGAYSYLQMIGELQPIQDSLQSSIPKPEEVAAWIDIALYRGVHPARGIALIIEHYGLCQAITACESLFAQNTPAPARRTAVEQVVDRLHHDLVQRLASEIEAKEGSQPRAHSIADLISARTWLFDDDNYHIDTSHLQAAVRMARLIDSTKAFEQATELCRYGEKLSPKYRYADPEPFADVYADSRRFFETLLGRSTDEGLAYFKEKAHHLEPADVGTFPIEVYLRLLQGLGRQQEAIAFLQTRSNLVPGNLGGLVDTICEEVGDYSMLAAWARDRENVPAYLAALLADKRPTES
jgi:hypothetical protein